MRLLREIIVCLALCVLTCAQASLADEVLSPLVLEQSNDLSPAHFAYAGQIVNFTLTATNTGSDTIHDLGIVTSLSLSNFTCLPATPAMIAPQESMTCVGQYVISDDDLRAGSLVNIAYASSDEFTTEGIGQTLYAARGHLALLVMVVNNNAGRASADMWLVSADGVSSLAGWGLAEDDVSVGEYTLKREEGPTGYSLKSLSCKDDFDAKLPLEGGKIVTIEEGANVVCTFLYDDKVPRARPASVSTSEPPSYGYIPSVLTDIPELVGSPSTAGVGTDVVVDPGCSCSAQQRSSAYGSWPAIGLLLLAFGLWRKYRRQN